ncbi:MAG: hypothetical protein RL685_2270 [Pseudomonadota bacterium]|jgi:hypothetical protein
MSGADDSIAITTFDVNDVQNAISDRGSDHNNSISAGAVVQKHRPRIGKNGSRFGEGHAMLAKIGLRLGVIPFKVTFNDRRHGILNYGP